jgi:drug/metabolite transporter (DMT)-like permease
MELLIKSILAAIIWGIFPFVVRHMSATLPLSVIPLLLSLVWFVCSLVHNIMKYKSGLFKTYLASLDATDIMITVLIGFVFMFLIYVFYIDVVSYASPQMINVYISIMSLSSLVSLFYVLFVEGYQLSRLKIFGVCLISLGVFMLLLGSK